MKTNCAEALGDLEKTVTEHPDSGKKRKSGKEPENNSSDENESPDEKDHDFSDEEAAAKDYNKTSLNSQVKIEIKLFDIFIC